MTGKVERKAGVVSVFSYPLKILLAIGAVLSAMLVIGKDAVEFQKLWPDIYYPIADGHCKKNPAGFSPALRAGNLRLIRCYIESGRSATNLLPQSDKFAYIPPLALVAESCNAKAVEYMIKVAGADPRDVVRYDYHNDERKLYHITPNGRCADTPAMIVETHCHAEGEPLSSEGEKSIRLLKEAELRIDATGRDLLHINDSCPWKTGSLKR